MLLESADFMIPGFLQGPAGGQIVGAGVTPDLMYPSGPKNVRMNLEQRQGNTLSLPSEIHTVPVKPNEILIGYADTEPDATFSGPGDKNQIWIHCDYLG
jgi:hypothetical protein